jgi:hypothetical protein
LREGGQGEGEGKGGDGKTADRHGLFLGTVGG